MSVRVLALIAVLVAASPAAGQESAPNGGEVALIGLHGGVAERLAPALEAFGLRVRSADAERLSTDPSFLRGTDVALLQGIRGDRLAAASRALALAREARPGFRAFSLSPGAGSAGQSESRTEAVENDPALVAYYAGATEENLRRLGAYVAHTFFAREARVLPPIPRTSVGLFHPAHEGAFETADDFRAWSLARGRDPASAPRVAVAVHGLHLEFQQPLVVKALILALERRGIVAVALVDAGEGLQGLRERYEANMLAFRPDAVIHTCHSTDTVAFRTKLDVPHLHSIFFTRDPIDAWQAGQAGLDGRTIAFQIMTQEVLGAIEPLVGGGTSHGHGSGEAVVPIRDRIERIAARAARWAALRRKPNAEKRVAVFYYDRELDPSALMRGSTTGMFMNAPRSLVNVLRRLLADGYAISKTPKDDAELIRWMLRGGRQVGLWAKDVLEREVREGDPVLIPAKEYARWLEEDVPAARRAEIVARYGPPPGDIMTWKDDRGESFIVVPRIDLGGVILLPQPLRGEAQDPSLLHDKTAPPPHNYLATYLWLRKSAGMDAMIHFGTHGSEFFFPGKRTGLAADDWCDLLLGDLPNICPWIVNNLGEVAPAKRRTDAVIVSHATPPVVEGGLADDLQNLHDDLEKLLGLEEGALKEKFRRTVSEAARRQRLTDDLKISGTPALLDDSALKTLDAYLHEIREAKTPTTLHVFGEPPQKDLLVPYVVSCLKERYRKAVAALLPKSAGRDGGPGAPALEKKAEELVGLVIRNGLEPKEAVSAAGLTLGDEGAGRDVVQALDLAKDLAGRIGRAGEEMDGLVRALAGRFVPPGSGGSPARNPDAAPGGRNLYLVNPDEIPAKPSFELGKKLVSDFAADYRARHGRYPTRIAFSLNASSTFQDFGVLESEILAALGCEPVWDEKNAVSDVRVVPRVDLGRPRIDVLLAGQGFYRDTLASRMILIDRAVRKVAALDEPENPVRTETGRIEKELLALGVSAGKAARLARARLFGESPDESGNPRYSYAVDRSGTWDSRTDLARAWLAGMGYAYTEGAFGEEAPDAFRSAAQNTDVVMRTWTDPVRSPLTDRYAWLRGGSLALALRELTGREPEYVLSDVRDADRARTVSAEDALAEDFRVRISNRKWIEGMMREGYAGADQIANAVSNAFGWATMREGSVRADMWDRVKDVLLDDALGLHVREFFEKENPHAFQEMVGVLLESVRKGFWPASEEVMADLARAYAESIALHGEGNGIRSAGNDKLAAFVVKSLGGPGKIPAAAGIAPAPVIVQGPKLVPESGPDKKSEPEPEAARDRSPGAPPEPADAAASLPLIGLAALALVLLGFAFTRR